MLLNSINFTVKMEEMTDWMCENCGYKFRRQKAWKEELCPYCGKTGHLKINAIQKFIDDVPNGE